MWPGWLVRPDLRGVRSRRPMTPSGGSIRSVYDVVRAVEQLRQQRVESVALSGELIVLAAPGGASLRREGGASDIAELLGELAAAPLAAHALAARYVLQSVQAKGDVAPVVTATARLDANRADQPRRPTGSGSLQRLWACLPLPPGPMTTPT